MGARVVHFEVPFDNGERALAFYRDVFEWDINAMPEMQYNIVSTGPTGEHGPHGARVHRRRDAASARIRSGHR